MPLAFEWDARKARTNKSKHKVSFDEAKTLFNDPFLITFPDDDHSEGEERHISIGRSAQRRTLLAVHTEQEAGDAVIIRIISCRKATRTERKAYEEGKV